MVVQVQCWLPLQPHDNLVMTSQSLGLVGFVTLELIPPYPLKSGRFFSKNLGFLENIFLKTWGFFLNVIYFVVNHFKKKKLITKFLVDKIKSLLDLPRSELLIHGPFDLILTWHI